MTHLTWGGYWGEGRVYDNEFRCFGCTGSVVMQDYLAKNPKDGGGGW